MTQEPPQTPKKHNRPVRRPYTDKERADALAALQASGESIYKTAQKLGIPDQTLRLWVKGRAGDRALEPVEQRVELASVRAESKRDLNAALEHARWLYLDRLSEPQAVQTTSGYYAAMTTKTLTDQIQLLKGGPTQIVSLASFLGQIALPEPPTESVDVLPVSQSKTMLP